MPLTAKETCCNAFSVIRRGVNLKVTHRHFNFIHLIVVIYVF